MNRVCPCRTALILCALASGVSVAAPAQEIEIQGPDAILRGISFPLTVTTPRIVEARPITIRLADGTEVAQTMSAPLGAVTVQGITVTGRDQLPVRITVGADRFEFSEPLVPGWVSLLPPLIAIALALVFHEVVTSLFVGVWIGCLFLAGYNPFAALLMTVERYVTPALADAEHTAIVVFSLLLGGMVGVLGRSGGTQAIVDVVRPLATSRRRGQLATWAAGLAIFFDDYANTLIVGNTMRPLTDKLKISREKLAYIVDSTAAPVTAIVFVSTWVGYEISLIGDGLRLAAEQNVGNAALVNQLTSASPFDIFIRSIPHLFYPILAIFAVALFAASRRDFGAMLKAEQRAVSGGGVFRPGAQLAADTEGEVAAAPDGVPLRWWNAAVPVIVVVVTVLAGLVYTGTQSLDVGEARTLRNIFGNADPFVTLLWGSLLGCVTAILLAVGQRILSLRDAISAWVGGVRAMVLAVVILVLAWSLGEITSSLSTASYLAGIISDRLPLALIPTTVFVVAALIAFATGTSWGTMAILIPLVIPLSIALGANLDGGAATTAFVGGIASVLAGSIFGDHCSPISDTTVLSSTASGCDHVDHVRTQLPYALLVAVAAIFLGSLPTAAGLSPWLSILLGAVGIFLFVWFVGKPVDQPASG